MINKRDPLRISKLNRLIKTVAIHTKAYATVWWDEVHGCFEPPHEDLLKKVFKNKYERVKSLIEKRARKRLKRLGPRIEKLAKTTAGLIISQSDIYEPEFINIEDYEVEYILPHERILKKVLKGLYVYFISSLNWELTQDADLFIGPDDDYDPYWTA